MVNVSKACIIVNVGPNTEQLSCNFHLLLHIVWATKLETFLFSTPTNLSSIFLELNGLVITIYMLVVQ